MKFTKSFYFKKNTSLNILKVLEKKNLENIKQKNSKMSKPKILCIIPARKGSTGLPNKNIKKLADKPLIEWTLGAAMKSRLISKTVVSSDSEKVIKICKKKQYSSKIDVPFRRPKNISGNRSPISKTIIHALNYYKKKLNLTILFYLNQLLQLDSKMI